MTAFRIVSAVVVVMDGAFLGGAPLRKRRTVYYSDARHCYLFVFQSALERLEELQAGDFQDIFRSMGGRPVVIRLLDPPLHEFLPGYTELTV